MPSCVPQPVVVVDEEAAGLLVFRVIVLSLARVVGQHNMPQILLARFFRTQSRQNKMLTLFFCDTPGQDELKIFGKATAIVLLQRKNKPCFFVLGYRGIFSTYRIRWIRTCSMIIFLHLDTR
jgi:hypothetical protein